MQNQGYKKSLIDKSEKIGDFAHHLMKEVSKNKKTAWQVLQEANKKQKVMDYDCFKRAAIMVYKQFGIYDSTGTPAESVESQDSSNR